LVGKNNKLICTTSYEEILQVCDPKLLPQEIQNENNALNSVSFHLLLLLEKGSAITLKLRGNSLMFPRKTVATALYSIKTFNLYGGKKRLPITLKLRGNNIKFS